MRLKLIQTKIASAIAAFGRVDDELANQIVFGAEIVMERGAVLGAGLGDNVANRHAVDPMKGKKPNRRRF